MNDTNRCVCDSNALVHSIYPFCKAESEQNKYNDVRHLADLAALAYALCKLICVYSNYEAHLQRKLTRPVAFVPFVSIKFTLSIKPCTTLSTTSTHTRRNNTSNKSTFFIVSLAFAITRRSSRMMLCTRAKQLVNELAVNFTS